ncbi:MAG: chemotaxis protein CheA, partial [Syntrophales bacterium]|nr:chemotaxis protein CheA [Syntrophales bacterium]
LKVTPMVIDVILEGADTLKSMIGLLRDALAQGAESVASVDTQDLEARVRLLEQGGDVTPPVKRLGEILVEEGIIKKDTLEEAIKEATKEGTAKKIGEVLISQKLVTPKQVSRALRKQAEQVTDTATTRVDTRKLDDMIDMVGELVITQAMIQQDIKNQMNADRNLMRDINQLFRITSSLQRVSTSLRMIPIKQSFQRMSRLIRDLAKDSGKYIGVELIGEDTEIDRNMVDEIYNPLVHLVRNAVDHGLETPEERLRAGKPERGLVQLKAYHRGGNIVIEIADDGRGLNKEKILKKALACRLVDEGENLSDQEIYRLIFHPGLSTAEKVTDVSGRGVGMDVVKQAVDKLRGKIEIESTPGKGTTFITSFPLTMAIIDGMIVRVGTQRYILPTVTIRQALRPARSTYANVIGRGEQINVRGKLLPLVRLNELFAVDDVPRDPWDAIIVVVEGNGRSKAVMVDEILGKTEVVIKSLGEGMRNIKGIAGGAILGDGQVGLIIDAEGLFELSETTV